jgi:hypothetical protein
MDYFVIFIDKPKIKRYEKAFADFVYLAFFV